MVDPYDLNRFIDAQEGVYEHAVAELAAGEKRSHWMWFMFPQIRGLGRSSMAVRFAIGSLEEAQAYASHPLLGSRLEECTRLVNKIEGRTVHQIFGTPDDMKFRSSMTLFALAAPDNHHFPDALSKYFSGVPDPATVDLLKS